MHAVLLVAAAAALLCSQAQGQMHHMMDMGMMDMIMPSQNMSSPCYADPTAEDCTLFRRAHADATQDLTSLCGAMGFMNACSLRNQCMNGTADGNSTWCKPWAQVGTICLTDDGMSKMKGCEAYNALCGVNVTTGVNVTETSVVEMCSDPPVVPNVPSTMATKAAIVAICEGEPNLAGCSQCDMTMTDSWAMCSDYLTTLATLCQEMPDNENCGSFWEFCSSEGVSAAFPELCPAAE